MIRRWASGAKLTRDTVDVLRALVTRYDGPQRDAFIAAQASLHKVHIRTMQRMLSGQTWLHIKGKTLSTHESKKCTVCGKIFVRAWANGRRRSDRFWNQKRTCNSSCATKLAWQEGHFKGRAMPGQRKYAISRLSFWQRLKALFGF